ncbi:hypothetical protein K2173_000750 [Erythroxylum novogranatense]|uniref:Uncharacterized protein n=1 Tax=Erythroxylum novogranatense TaxID=1862640 RepID=A0AAV8T3W0_9ROSI|nr:hypothetical protein K2173_000750 [Erythroxylum novogranatense]
MRYRSYMSHSREGIQLNFRIRKMGSLVYFFLLVPAISWSPLSFASHSHLQWSDRLQLIGQVQESKLKVAQLESVLEEIAENLTARNHHLAELEKRIEEMDARIKDLRFSFSNFKAEPLPFGEKIRELADEVRDLWAVLRKNNFELHVLESKAMEAEEKLETETSRVEQMADIVTEQWIQIRQFEQALQLKLQVLKDLRQAKRKKCIFFKVMTDLYGKHIQNAIDLLDSLLSEKGSSNLIQFLDKLQGIVKQEMESHRVTACLANKEVVFFVASALIIFPVLSAWTLLTSQWR